MLKKLLVITFSLAMLGGFGACKKGGGGGGGGPMDGGGGGGGGPKAGGGPGGGGGCKGGKCGGGQRGANESVINEPGAGQGLQPARLRDGREVLIDFQNGRILDVNGNELDPNDPFVAELIAQIQAGGGVASGVGVGAGAGGVSAGGENGFPNFGDREAPPGFSGGDQADPSALGQAPAFGDGPQGESTQDQAAQLAALQARLAEIVERANGGGQLTDEEIALLVQAENDGLVSKNEDQEDASRHPSLVLPVR